MRLRVLGTLELVDGRRDGATSEALRSTRLRRLLAVLLVHAGSVVSVDRIADVIWGDSPPANPEAAVHNLVSRLRAALRTAGASADDSPDPVALLTRAPGYVLQATGDAVDAACFEDLAARARACAVDRPERAVELFDAALGLWRGVAYAEFADEDFARAEASRLEELRVSAVEDRVQATLDLGRCTEAIARLEALVAAHPLRERPHAQLILALYRAGRQADALAVYRDYRERLDEELGLEPSAALQRLQADVLRQDAALDPGPAPGAAPPTGSPTPSATPPLAGSSPAVPPVGNLPAVGDPPAVGNLPAVLPDLVGRDETLAAVSESLGEARVVTLVGAGGVGKTSVALHAAARAPRCADGVWLCELAGVAEPEAVADALASVLGVQQRQGLTVVERLVEYLRPKHLLLVLDNCEH
ncbi:MAG TPA: BTAD domain-containing putative transcriptional regulator, partial [Mycobacteriales bacterium]|nr:BTAD domain-containing putative transcriptional regulator [Mycobacteriales bacterium]